MSENDETQRIQSCVSGGGGGGRGGRNGGGGPYSLLVIPLLLT